MAGRYRGVTRRGQGWQVSFTLPCGTRCREIVRLPVTRKGEEEAFSVRARILAEIDRGVFDYAETFPKSKMGRQLTQNSGKYLTIKNALREYLIRQAPHLAYSTRRDYEYRIFKHLIPAFGDMTISKLSAQDIRQWRANIDLSAKTINNILIPLKGVFDHAFEEEIIDRNPFDRLRYLPVGQKEPDPFNKNEIKALLNYFENNYPTVRGYFQFAFATGLRTGELLALTWDDVDISLRKLSVTKSKTRGRLKAPKTPAGRRVVDLSPDAIAALSFCPRLGLQSEAIFTDPRTGLPWKTAKMLRRNYWYPALRELGPRKRVPYQTRHTFASQKLSGGANPMYIAQQMGHRDWGMIRKVYGRYIADNVDPAHLLYNPEGV